MLLLIIFLLGLIHCAPQTPPTNNVLYDYNYFRKITFQVPEMFNATNVTSPNTTLIDMDVLVTLDTESLIEQGILQSNCFDIRFVMFPEIDGQNATLLPHWIEGGCNTPSTNIWLKIEQVEAGYLFDEEIGLYYGNEYAVDNEMTFNGNFIMGSMSHCRLNSGWYFFHELEGRLALSDDFYGEFEYPTHSHAFSARSSLYTDTNGIQLDEVWDGGSCNDGDDWTVYASHSHDYSGVLNDLVSDLIPESYQTFFCQNTKIIMEQNLIGMFDVKNYSYIPNGWQPLTNMEGYYHIGTSIASQIGTIIGNPSHIHTPSGSTYNFQKADPDHYTRPFFKCGSASNCSPRGNHGHSLSSTIVGSGTNQPPSYSFLYGKIIDISSTSSYHGLISMVSEMPPLGWKKYNINGYFPIASAIPHVKNDISTHSHQVSGKLTTASSSISCNHRGEMWWANNNHKHSLTTTLTSSSPQIPPYLKVIYAKRKDSVKIYMSNEIVNEFYTPSSESFGWEYIIMMSAIISAIGIIIISASISMFIIIIAIQKAKLKKFNKIEDVDLILEEQKLERFDITSNDTSKARININEKLFEIDYADLKILKMIGKGGSNSSVFQCEYQDQMVAFKCFQTSDMCGTQEHFEEFEKEVTILASISHKNILTFIGACIRPPRVGFIMELAEHGSVKNFLQMKLKQNECGYDINEKLRISYEICLGMNFLHSKNIIHRDLKCDNILINSKEEPKIMDFGLSKIINNSNKTHTSRIGTSYYIAPELVFSGHYNEKVDVFSFAMVFYEIITDNFMPFGKKTFNLEIKMANDPSFRPPIEDLLIDNWMKEILCKSWAHDAKVRDSFKVIGEKIKNKIGKCTGIQKSKKPIVPKGKSCEQKESEKEKKLRIQNENLKRKNKELERQLLELQKQLSMTTK